MLLGTSDVSNRKAYLRQTQKLRFLPSCCNQPSTQKLSLASIPSMDGCCGFTDANFMRYISCVVPPKRELTSCRAIDKQAKQRPWRGSSRRGEDPSGSMDGESKHCPPSPFLPLNSSPSSPSSSFSCPCRGTGTTRRRCGAPRPASGSSSSSSPPRSSSSPATWWGMAGSRSGCRGRGGSLYIRRGARRGGCCCWCCCCWWWSLTNLPSTLSGLGHCGGWIKPLQRGESKCGVGDPVLHRAN